ncbi:MULTISPECIES: hypothetical protein [Sinorhizobium]|uniref:hypothetical protein n=1 Tax=Sinorhizobium TaxID=28105 RepID=UPI000BBFC955|nr:MULTISPECIES: hypothetical protein [Sinorhizobium]ASY56165.1 hypothetical protein SS05631_c12200 [Sinorhizobium sp. CCBAU 05631]
MNTYRAMGVTGYLFTNDSATEKIRLPEFFRFSVRQISHKTKPADETSAGGFF